MILWPPVWQSRCIENRNSSTGAQVIATSQMYRGMYSQMYCQIYLQMYLKMSSQTAIAGVKTSERSPQQSGSGDEVKRANQRPTETSFYEIPMEFGRLEIQFVKWFSSDLSSHSKTQKAKWYWLYHTMTLNKESLQFVLKYNKHVKHFREENMTRSQNIYYLRLSFREAL